MQLLIRADGFYRLGTAYGEHFRMEVGRDREVVTFERTSLYMEGLKGFCDVWVEQDASEKMILQAVYQTRYLVKRLPRHLQEQAQRILKRQAAGQPTAAEKVL